MVTRFGQHCWALSVPIHGLREQVWRNAPCNLNLCTPLIGVVLCLCYAFPITDKGDIE